MLSPHKKEPETVKATIHRALKREYPESLGVTQLIHITGKGDKSVDSALRKLIEADMVEKVGRGRYMWLSDANALEGYSRASSTRARVLSAIKREYPHTLTLDQLYERISVPPSQIRNSIALLSNEKLIESVGYGTYSWRSPDGM